MKHADLMNEQDRADLELSDKLVADGNRLRKQVFTRLRARAFRKQRKAAAVYSPAENQG